MLSNFSQFIKTHQEDIVLVIGVILISLLSFAAGYITAKQQEKQPLQIEQLNTEMPINDTNYSFRG